MVRKIAALGNVAPHSLTDRNQSFEVTCYLHFQGTRVAQPTAIRICFAFDTNISIQGANSRSSIQELPPLL
jgi:hypothetical protein